ncbi:MAG: hypothetical protein LRY30_00495, partial [Gammaproteobacteria bacterium]|nr:hypothetical protein [Gammaproteobacteria bacterium]
MANQRQSTGHHTRNSYAHDHAFKKNLIALSIAAITLCYNSVSLVRFAEAKLSQLTWDNIHFVTEGIEILLPRSKTDQAGEGQTCAIPYGDNTLCPVSALLS